MPIKAILTDIEGTTSAVSFVFDVLFPYAVKHLPDFVRSHAGARASHHGLRAERSKINPESGPAAGLPAGAESFRLC